MKLYLDSDIFLAAFKDTDHLKSSAMKFLETESKKHELFTSTATLLEVWHYLRRNNLEERALEAVKYIESIVSTVMPLDAEQLTAAIELAQAHSLSPTDAIHANYAKKLDGIVATDHAFDRVPGLKKIDFSKI